MLETDLTPINNQTYLAPSFSRAFQQRASYRLVPNPDPYGDGIQQTAQAPGGGRKGGVSRRGDLIGDLAQMNRAAQARPTRSRLQLRTRVIRSVGRSCRSKRCKVRWSWLIGISYGVSPPV